MIADAALNDLLNVYFRNGTPPTALYLGLIDLTGFTAFDAADTMSSHAGWTELTTYDESTRPAWSPSASVAEQLSNASLVTFTINSPSSVYGVFLSTNNTKGGTSGILIGPGKLDAVQVLQSGETLKVQLVLPAVSGG